jgi:hypothetical protein
LRVGLPPVTVAESIIPSASEANLRKRLGALNPDANFPKPWASNFGLVRVMETRMQPARVLNVLVEFLHRLDAILAAGSVENAREAVGENERRRELARALDAIDVPNIPRSA